MLRNSKWGLLGLLWVSAASAQGVPSGPSASGLTPAVTPITGCTDTTVLFNDNGFLGCNTALEFNKSTSLTSATKVSIGGATIGTNALAVTGTVNISDTLASGPQTVTGVVGSSALTLTGATQTTSQPIINATQTWNAIGVAFTAFKLNITNTASSSASVLADIQEGGASKFQVASTSSGVAGPYVPNSATLTFSTGALGSVTRTIGVAANIGVKIGSGTPLIFTSTTDVYAGGASSGLSSGGSAGVIAVGNGTAGNASGQLNMANAIVSSLAATGSGTGGHLVCADNAGKLYTVAGTTC